MGSFSMPEVIEIPLSKRGKYKGKYTAIVSPEDADLAEKNWSVRLSANTQYAGRREWRENKGVILHRVILGRLLGRELDRKEWVDHIDGNGLNNQRHNLRLADGAQNTWNARKRRDCELKYIGIMRNTRGWQAQITVRGKRHSLGTYDTQMLAAIAYNHAAVKHRGEYARVNEIPGWQKIMPNKRKGHLSSSGHRYIYPGKWGFNVVIKGRYVGYRPLIEGAISLRDYHMKAEKAAA